MLKDKKLLKAAQQELAAFREKTKTLIFNLAYPERRLLMTVDAISPEGQLNGMTVVELITIAKLTEGTGERVVLEAQNKTIKLSAERTTKVNVSSL